MYVQESETYMADDNVTLCICYLTEGKTSRPTIIKGDSPMNKNGDSQLTTHNRIFQIHLLFCPLPYFLLSLLLIHVICCWQCLLLQRWRSSRVVRPVRAAHSCRTPWRGPSQMFGVLGFMKHLAGVSCVARLLQQRVLRIALDGGGTRWRVRVRTMCLLENLILSEDNFIRKSSYLDPKALAGSEWARIFVARPYPNRWSHI